jgi:large subunit ribosomal protein L25
MDETSLAYQLRDGTGKGKARRLRAVGRIPAVLYGHGNTPVCLSLESRELERLLQKSHAGMNTLIDLQGEGEASGKTVMIKELQREAVRGTLVHADLYEIDKDERVVVNVPVHTTGIAEGTVMGGLVDHVHREVEVSCLVSAIPDELVVDVTPLDVGDSIHARDLQLPDGVELKTDPDVTLVSVVAPAKLEEEAPAEEDVEEVAEGEAVTEESPDEGEEKAED